MSRAVLVNQMISFWIGKEAAFFKISGVSYNLRIVSKSDKGFGWYNVEDELKTVDAVVHWTHFTLNKDAVNSGNPMALHPDNKHIARHQSGTNNCQRSRYFGLAYSGASWGVKNEEAENLVEVTPQLQAVSGSENMYSEVPYNRYK